MTDTDLPDGEYTAVVDAIEDGIARVFFEQDGSDVFSTRVSFQKTADRPTPF